MVFTKAFSLGEKVAKISDFCRMWGKKLATQGILTCCATRTLPYHLYADECELLALTASLTSVSLSKKSLL